MRKLLLVLVFVLVLMSALLVFRRQAVAPSDNTPPPTVASFDKQQYPLDQPTSQWVVVNKKMGLDPSEYEPAELVTPNIPLNGGADNENMKVSGVIGSSLEKLVAAADQAKFSLKLVSGYRSYGSQRALYNSYVQRDGQESADSFSALPGYSEHQTGLAIDLARSDNKCSLEACFGELPEGKWLAEHAHEYGFIIRYPKDKREIVGYEYEPWHLRFVGVELATEIHKANTTMEEFFGLPPASDY